jgi:hypothetical protein
VVRLSDQGTRFPLRLPPGLTQTVKTLFAVG